MRFNSVICLLPTFTTQDDLGNSIENNEAIEGRKIFAEKNSVKQSEFYQAAMAGLKPEIVFLMWTHSYKGETKLKYKGKIYTIIRTFERPEGKMELYCEVKAGV